MANSVISLLYRERFIDYFSLALEQLFLFLPIEYDRAEVAVNKRNKSRTPTSRMCVCVYATNKLTYITTNTNMTYSYKTMLSDNYRNISIYKYILICI